jgi:Rrf2 family transcriptional regulator, iron-sulfur cluster assembly transcription factor
MIYSRSAEYAIHALTELAHLPPGEFALVKTLAAETEIPSHFLAKLLQDMARIGLLKSTKGPHGGFRLNVPPEELSMLRVVEVIDGPGRFDRCLGGNAECNEKVACGMHDGWMALRLFGGDFDRRSGESPGREASSARGVAAEEAGKVCRTRFVRGVAGGREIRHFLRRA